MVAIENPRSFVVIQDCQKAASQNGFRREMGDAGGWAGYASTTAPVVIHLAASGQNGPWFLALEHAGVIEELDKPVAEMDGPGLARYAFGEQKELYETLHRVYELGVSLPEAPLNEFKRQTKDMPAKTEAERVVVQRIGQNIFRGSLMDYWQEQCPLTGITEPELLRASHIIPWKDCRDDGERLNVYNGLLLSALWDAAFDRGLASFDDSGEPVFSSALGSAARGELRWHKAIDLSDKHRERLAWHRERVFRG